MAINWKSLGLACGIMWALYVLCLGLCSTTMNYGTPIVIALSSIYIGLQPTWLGSIIGALLAFFDGLFAGIIIALVYNKFEKL